MSNPSNREFYLKGHDEGYKEGYEEALEDAIEILTIRLEDYKKDKNDE